MGTFAISYRPNEEHSLGSETPELIVHFNHWQLAKGSRGLQFIDIGFSFCNAHLIGQIKLIVPFVVSGGEVIDLSYTLQDIENLKSVFNRILRVNHNGDGSLSEVSNDNDPSWRFNFLLLTIDPGQVELTARDEHSIYVVRLTEVQKRQIAAHPNRSLYMRLRILGNATTELTSISKPSFSKPFLTSFYEEQMIEVNFNRVRNLPRTIVDTRDLPFTTSSMNYFLIKDSRYNFKSSNRPCDDLRRLEQRIWNNYITLPVKLMARNPTYYEHVQEQALKFNLAEARMSKEHLLAYQWDFRGDSDNFNVFAWFQREFINLRSFIIGLIVISLFFELTGNYLYDWLSNEPKQPIEQGTNAVKDGTAE